MMKDETEAFERHLSRQPTREIPGEWRAEILSTARAATPVRTFVLSTIIHQLSAGFRLHPRAWAGLAAVWVVILALHLAASDPSKVTTWNTPPPSPEMLMVLHQQKLLLAELVERPEPRAAEPPKALPLRPRSDRYYKTFTALSL